MSNAGPRSWDGCPAPGLALPLVEGPSSAQARQEQTLVQESGAWASRGSGASGNNRSKSCTSARSPLGSRTSQSLAGICFSPLSQ